MHFGLSTETGPRIGHSNVSGELKLLDPSVLFSDAVACVPNGQWLQGKTKQLSSNEILFHKGDHGKQLFILVSGRLSVSTLSLEGREWVLEILEPGSIFGEVALLDEQPRSATVTALEASEVIAVSRREVMPFLLRNPQVAISLLATVAQRLRVANEYFEDTLFLDLPTRLAKRLLALAERYGVDKGSSIHIEFRLTQQTLGQLVCASRESVNRQMRRWQEAGLLSCHKSFVTLHQPEALRELTR